MNPVIGITWRDRATMLMAILAICLSCIAIGIDIGIGIVKSSVTEEAQVQPELPQAEQSKTPKF